MFLRKLTLLFLFVAAAECGATKDGGEPRFHQRVEVLEIRCTGMRAAHVLFKLEWQGRDAEPQRAYFQNENWCRLYKQEFKKVVAEAPRCSTIYADLYPDDGTLMNFSVVERACLRD